MPTPTRSLPTRGAWIEIFLRQEVLFAFQSRSPHGERGLKYITPFYTDCQEKSLPTRGAWIEIFCMIRRGRLFLVAPHTGSVDLLTRVFFYPTLEHCTLTSTGYRYLFCNGQTKIKGHCLCNVLLSLAECQKNRLKFA